jgi:O-Antigen ligase
MRQTMTERKNETTPAHRRNDEFASKTFSVFFGALLGLSLLKFGNPVVLEKFVTPPQNFHDWLISPWPMTIGFWLLAVVVVFGLLVVRWKISVPKWLLALPLIWLGWQLISATQTVDAKLTQVTLAQFFGCVACYFLGAFVCGREGMMRWLLIGVLAAFTFCLIRAIDQRLFEFPQNRQMLIAGERAGWTNIPPKMFLQMKRDNVVITTNGVDVANPAILAKFAEGRVNGTLVYPNALAGAILLLFPISLALAFNCTNHLKPFIRAMMITLTLFLGGAAFFWSGSKLGWLIAIAIIGLCLFRLKWSGKLKLAALVTVMLIGFGFFTIRFENYFAAGATSVVARFDYWRAAAETTYTHPLFGTGPGTFQRPYAQIKSPKAEMARLAHNDYLEQFSDSGIAGGIIYGTWIVLSLTTIGRRIWRFANPVTFALFVGLLGWFVQGFGEFSLYIPGLAWIAFTLLGCLLAMSETKTINRVK